MQLEVVAYNEAGGIVQQRVVELNNILGWNTIRKHLEKSLLKASVLKQAPFLFFSEVIKRPLQRFKLVANPTANR